MVIIAVNPTQDAAAYLRVQRLQPLQQVAVRALEDQCQLSADLHDAARLDGGERRKGVAQSLEQARVLQRACEARLPHSVLVVPHELEPQLLATEVARGKAPGLAGSPGAWHRLQARSARSSRGAGCLPSRPAHRQRPAAHLVHAQAGVVQLDAGLLVQLEYAPGLGDGGPDGSHVHRAGDVVRACGVLRNGRLGCAVWWGHLVIRSHTLQLAERAGVPWPWVQSLHPPPKGMSSALLLPSRSCAAQSG
jgi:hypothetical protein